jgi:hypothetical protein
MDTTGSPTLIDKSRIDAVGPESILIIFDQPDRVSPISFSESMDHVLDRIEAGGKFLDLSSLRLVLLTPDLSERTKEWQRQLGIAEAGVLKQAEGEVAGKTMTWG